MDTPAIILSVRILYSQKSKIHKKYGLAKHNLSNNKASVSIGFKWVKHNYS